MLAWNNKNSRNFVVCLALGLTLATVVCASPTGKFSSKQDSSTDAATGELWGDDSAGGEWPQVSPTSPSPPDYEDYDDEEGEEQDAEGNLLIRPPGDGLVLQDDDDLDGPFRVRHTSETADDDHPEFTIDEGDGNDGKDEDFVLEETSNRLADNDFEDPSSSRRNVPERRSDDQPPSDNGDLNVNDDEDDDDNNPMFSSPEEDAQVIYGDHVFLY